MRLAIIFLIDFFTVLTIFRRYFSVPLGIVLLTNGITDFCGGGVNHD